MKNIAFYLPQYHSIPENDLWWGKDFTEWTNVKQSRKYHDGQNQPRVPLNNNYYNLLDENVLKWQSKLAAEYGLYGFCFYHYWFNGHMLLEKPVEKYLDLNNSDKIHYCICWANENWTKAWADRSNEILIAQTHGDSAEWETHFNYLLPFFRDEKYIVDGLGRPVFVIYRPEIIPNLKKMLVFWNELAVKNNLPGICFVYQQYSFLLTKNSAKELFDYHIEYQPDYAWAQMNDAEKTLTQIVYSKIPSNAQKFISKIKHRVINDEALKNRKCKVYDYDEVWEHIIRTDPTGDDSIPCAFVDFDNSPRRKENGTFIKGVTAEKFDKYYGMLVEKARNKYKSDFLFIFAWNEWGESAYLEPDEMNGYKALETIKKYSLE